MRSLWLVTLLSLFASNVASAKPCLVKVSVATSLRIVLQEIATAFELNHKACKVMLNVAGSHALVKQIEAGADVDIFLPADEVVFSHARQKPHREQRLAKNELVLVGTLAVTHELDLLLAAKRIAVGQPTLPAGRYALQYLEQKGWAEQFKTKYVYVDNVRGVAALVDRKAAEAGFIYRTEMSLMTSKPKAVFNLSGVAIHYPALLLSKEKSAIDFYEFLFSKQAATVLRAQGFEPETPPHG